MNRFSFISLFVIGVAFLGVCGWSGDGLHFPPCHDYAKLSQELRTMQDGHSAIVQVNSIAESLEGRSVWLVELGKGTTKDRAKRPAMLVLAGVEGNQLAGSEAALAFIERICGATESVQSLLEKNTVYVIPRLNPDAVERYFKTPLVEQQGNLTPFDADRDGLTDEDGPDDLNGDGVISWIRVEDVEGTMIPHPNEARVLVEADAAKGEEGKWKLFLEGNDNDLDEKIDEDGPGEVNFNKNFPFNYTFFDADAGVYQCCEKETRALAEFVIEHPNIGLFVTFSSNGSLLKTPESGDSSSRRDPQTKLRKEDAKYFDYLGEQYRERMGITKEIDSSSVNGAFSDWIYFHRGRMSVSTPIWSPEISLALKKEKGEKKNDESAKEDDGNNGDDKSVEKENKDGSSDKKETDEKKDDKKKEDKRGKTEIDYLKWVEENAPEYFSAWKEFQHPDYPGQKAEIGGFAPYAKVMPPANLFDDFMKKNAEYLTWLIDKLPRIEIHDIEMKDLGNGVFDVCVKVKNAGYLPTVLAHGERTNEVFPTRVEIDISKEKILSGEAVSRIGPLQGSGGVEEVRWVLHAKPGEKVKIQVVSALGGSVERTLELKGE